MIIEGRIVKNFSLQEMMNNLAKEEIKLVLTPEAVEHAQMMQELRDWYGKPMDVSSWNRTEPYNKSIGGAANSTHLDCRATDISNIKTINETLVQKFIVAWQTICSIHHKVGGVEIYNWGMHFDSFSDKFGVTTFRLKDNR